MTEPRKSRRILILVISIVVAIGIVAAVSVAAIDARLQITPEVDLAALRAKENRELASYGWIDKESGVVRIPIVRAMDLIAQRGLPMRDDPDAPKPYRTTLDMQQARPLERETTPTPATK